LPTNWIADFRRLFDFGEAGRDDLRVQPAEFNITKRIDTLLGGERRNLLDINQLAPGLTISPGMVRPPEAGMQAPVSQPASLAGYGNRRWGAECAAGMRSFWIAAEAVAGGFWPLGVAV
jgi:hypothetical protein